MSDTNLVTTCNFSGRQYFIKMNANNNNLELIVTDKQTGEDWQCSYEASYIESITQKTGNFKQFSVFIAMLRSGLLKTSTCIYLELMTFEDLDALRKNRIRRPYSTYHIAQTNNNRRYLILTYTVEFDRIHYPLPLEYCGHPDPQILHQQIVRLEEEIVRLKDPLNYSNPNRNRSDTQTIIALQKRVEVLTEENQQLTDEIKRLTLLVEKRSKNNSQFYTLQDTMKNLEKSVLSERKSHHQLVEKLRTDKMLLSRELEQMKRIRNSDRISRHETISTTRPLKRMSDPGTTNEIRTNSYVPVLNRRQIRTNNNSNTNRSKSNRKASCGSDASSNRTRSNQSSQSGSRSTSRSSSIAKRNDNNNGKQKTKKKRKTNSISTIPKIQSRTSELDFSALEQRIQALQNMLQNSLTLT